MNPLFDITVPADIATEDLLKIARFLFSLDDEDRPPREEVLELVWKPGRRAAKFTWKADGSTPMVPLRDDTRARDADGATKLPDVQVLPALFVDIDALGD